MTERYAQVTVQPAQAWHEGLLEASLYVLAPCGALGYGLYAMAAGWGGMHTLAGLAAYGLGCAAILMRISR